MNSAVKALIKKDLRAVTDDRRMFSALLILPLIMTVLLPAVFVLIICLGSDSGDVRELLELLPSAVSGEDIRPAALNIALNYIIPAFFLMIPIMTSSVTAAGSFVGEKEKHTLETLLYCPLSLSSIFRAKVAASFFLSMLISFISFAVMIVTVWGLSAALAGFSPVLSFNWAVIMLLLSPALSLIAVTLIVRVSAKAVSVEESQQRAVFMILPLILIVAGQFAGIMLLDTAVLLAAGAVCAALAWILLKRAVRKFTYETLLRRQS